MRPGAGDTQQMPRRVVNLFDAQTYWTYIQFSQTGQENTPRIRTVSLCGMFFLGLQVAGAVVGGTKWSSPQDLRVRPLPFTMLAHAA
jgi:hypothetical protein